VKLLDPVVFTMATIGNGDKQNGGILNHCCSKTD